MQLEPNPYPFHIPPILHPLVTTLKYSLNLTSRGKSKVNSNVTSILTISSLTAVGESSSHRIIGGTVKIPRTLHSTVRSTARALFPPS